jgi:NAD(P)H-nitrite reductase large subunit
LLIASGSVNKYAPIKGLDQVKFFGLRGVDDYKSINEAVRQQGAKNITIIGGGFIGMELASALKMALKDQVNITILEANDTPLKHILGDKVGKVLQALSEKNGIKVQTSSVIK